MSAANHLYYGDNLDVLRRHVKDESVDLVYLDPPFNSNASYNVLFGHADGSRAGAQIKAFEDTWRWDQASAAAFEETVGEGGEVAQALVAFRQLLGDADMLAYLAMMAPRLVELRRVMRRQASIYLHCDPTASHYLKLLLDAVFGPENFRNEIVWERTTSHNMRTKGYVRANDVLLFFSKSREFTFNPQYTPYGPEQLKRFKRDDDGRLYKAENLTFSTPNPSRQFEWRGARPPANRSWGASEVQLEQWYEEGRILLRKDGVPRLDGLKVYLDETKGKPLGTNWTDIPRVGNTAGERLGYPTQKPVALLERIVSTSSDEGAVVLDPFCGCGTTIAAAQRLNRRWIGIDVTYLAVALMKSRLADLRTTAYDVIGEPTAADDAAELAAADPYQFQWWALGLINARPADGKKGGDKGVDGRLFFFDEPGGDAKQLIASVKAGSLTPAYVRDLGHVVEREGAQLGALISLKEPTAGMRAEAASAGFYTSPWGKHPRIQLVTVGELLAGKKLDMPATAGTTVALPAKPDAPDHPDQMTLTPGEGAE